MLRCALAFDMSHTQDMHVCLMNETSTLVLNGCYHGTYSLCTYTGAASAAALGFQLMTTRPPSCYPSPRAAAGELELKHLQAASVHSPLRRTWNRCTDLRPRYATSVDTNVEITENLYSHSEGRAYLLTVLHYNLHCDHLQSGKKNPEGVVPLIVS